MKNDLTEIIMVVDRSGSMGPLRDDAIGGFNTFLADQQVQPGQANLTLVLFNDHYDVVHNGKAIKEVPALTAETYVPTGMTALYDAVGRSINQVGKRLADLADADRPGKVILVILTDGQENSSSEFSKSQITEMIQHQQSKYSWQVVFLSSDIMAVQEAKTLGVMDGSRGLYAASAGGTRRAYADASSSVTRYRSGGDSNLVDPSSGNKN
jgi:hypothetical protein